MKFKVFGGKATTRGVRRFYFHVVSTNGKITLPSQGYPTASHAHRAAAQVWKSFAKANGGDYERFPMPYTKDSLLPVTRKKRTATKKAAAKKTLQRAAKRA